MSAAPAEAEQSGLRERKKQATRRAIKRAALTLAEERGVEHLTVEEISAAAEISTRTFFNYFARKEDALISETGDMAADLRAAIADRPATESALQALRSAMADSPTLLAAQQQREELLARHRLVRDTPVLVPHQLAQYAELEHEALAALAKRLDVDADRDMRPALLAALAVTVLRVVMQRWAADGTTPPGELVGEAFDLLEGEFL